MKRIVIALMSLLLTVPMMAQYGRPYGYNSHFGRPVNQSRYHAFTDIYYGLRIGGAFSTVSSDDPYLDGGSVRSGLNVGVVAGFQVAPRTPIYFETGLSYVEKGGEGHDRNSKFTYDLDYLEVPVVLKYDCEVAPNLNVQPYIGGFFAAGVGGKIKDFGDRLAYSSFDDHAFKRFDAGIKVGCGLQFDHLYAELGYDFGLANICHDSFDTSRTGSFLATVGVNF